MKYYYFLFLFAFSALLRAQTAQFVEMSNLPFTPAISGSIAFADVDGDGDQDVLITGDDSFGANVQVSELYTNDGSGEYTKVEGTPFDGVDDSSIAFADVDGDGDQDVLITGQNSSSVQVAKLYQNDGAGSFTEVSGTPFDGVLWSSVAFSDVDGDGDHDVIITGRNSVFQLIAKLYTNDGNGVFSLAIGTPFEGVRLGSTSFSDVDNDGDDDVLITGVNGAGVNTAKLYTNDGSGVFSEVLNTSFTGVSVSSSVFSDVDGDGDNDLLMIGGISFGRVAELYINDGTGIFTRQAGTPFEGVRSNGGIAVADVDDDGDQDVVFAGRNINNNGSTNFYLNNGSGIFTEAEDVPFEDIQGSVAFSDIDDDGDADLFMLGFNNESERIARLYLNNGDLGFSENVGTSLIGSYNGSVTFEDVDLDGDQDLFITGTAPDQSSVHSRLYLNDGTGAYTERSNSIADVRLGSVDFGDVDGDGDGDLLITGFLNSVQIARLYINLGNANFAQVTGTPFEAVYFSDAAFEDIDNDGDLDVLLSGANSSNLPVTKLYTNNGSGMFTEVSGTAFEAVSESAISFTDVDGDGDSDVFIAGLATSVRVTKLYNNDGNGVFTEVAGTPFDGVTSGSINAADFDGDGYKDVLITGQNGNATSNRIAKLFTNNGSGLFTEISTVIEGFNRSASVADVDGDGDPDVLITGSNGANSAISKLYINDGTGTFSELKGQPFVQVANSSSAIADVDNNGSQDIVIIGRQNTGDVFAELYLNIKDVKSPSFNSSATATIVENSTDVAYTATADEPVTFTLGSTKDEGLFAIANDNEIGFLSPPDFENPQDGNMDNDYVIDVIAADIAGNMMTLEVTISVTDVDESIIWNGSAWSNVTGPVATDNVIIDGNYMLSSGTSLAVLNFTTNTGHTVTVDNESTLIINGDLVNDGSITIASGSSLITYAANTMVGNDITIKRNTTHSDGKYSFVGTPVAQTANNTGAILGSSVYYYDETEPFGTNEGLDRWNEMTGQLVPGTGYTQAFQQEIIFTGVPNTGDITYTGTYTEDDLDVNEGWNLIANPYAAALNVGVFLLENSNITGAVYIWDDNGSDIERGSNADYIVANAMIATNNTPAGMANRYNQQLGTAQGFFVQFNDDKDLDITFEEDMRRVGVNSDNNFFRTSTLPVARINLTNAAGLFKQAVIGFAEDAAIDQLNRTYDAPAFNAKADNGIFTLKSGRTLTLNGLPNQWQTMQLQLNIKAAGVYTIAVELEAYSQPLYLVDNHTGESIDLRDEDYTFSATAGIDVDRFQLVSSLEKALAIDEYNVSVYAFEKVLHIQQPDDMERTYLIFNLQGKQLLSTAVQENAAISLSAFPSGIYLVFDGEKTHKIILN